MGMDTVIISIISIALIITVAYSFAMETNTLVNSIHSGFFNFQKTMINKLHTDIRIGNITWNSTGYKFLKVNVENIGDTKLSDYQLWDVVVVKNNTTMYLSYGTDWSVVRIYGDFVNPNILDPMEIAQIEIREQFEKGENIILKIVTPNGVVTTQKYVVG